MAPQPRKILVVDDEPDLELLVRQKFRHKIREGEIRFSFASNGVEALEKLREDDGIEMVLSDINMPQMDGLALLQQLGENNPNIRAVIVSAYGDMDNIRTAMNRGAFDFVTKPIDFDDLETTIYKTIRHLDLMREALASRDTLIALQQELDVSSNMQKSILPTVFPESEKYEIQASMTPAREVGGDFYDVIRLKNNTIGLVIADVSGKGVPAALFMMICRTLMKSVAIGLHSPEKVLREANTILLEENESCMFVTVFYAVFDPESGRLCYANGGHNPPVRIKAGGGSELLPVESGIALGVAPDATFHEQEITLAPGDALLLYTDGVTEAMNEKGELFGEQRLLSAMSAVAAEQSRQLTKQLITEVLRFADTAPQADDITCLSLWCGDASGGDAGQPAQTKSRKFLVRDEISTALPRLASDIDAFMQAHNSSADVVFAVQLAVEEVVTNALTHGARDGRPEVRIELRCDDDFIQLEISDDGTLFDPLQFTPRSTQGEVEEREIGGLGLHLVRETMDSVQYQERDGRNCLILKKRRHGAEKQKK